MHRGTQTLTRTPAHRHLTRSSMWSSATPTGSLLLGLCYAPTHSLTHSYTHAPGPALTLLHTAPQRSGAHHPVTSFTFCPEQLRAQRDWSVWRSPGFQIGPTSLPWLWMRPAGASSAPGSGCGNALSWTVGWRLREREAKCDF